MSDEIEITTRAGRFADHDDCLAAAHAELRAALGLDGWDLAPRWDDERERGAIVCVVPSHAMLGQKLVDGWSVRS